MADRPLKVFINYRRDDNRVLVQLLQTWLMMAYGDENVFMDFVSIPYFVPFADFIRQKVREADVLIAVIGPQWLNLLEDKAGKNELDYVRLEIEEARQHHKMIAPVLLENTPPLASSHKPRLPESLHFLVEVNQARVRSGNDVSTDVRRIVNALNAQAKRRGQNVVRPSSTASSPVPGGHMAPDFDIQQALRHFADAFSHENWSEALAWGEQMKASGAVIPAGFRLDARINHAGKQLAIQQEARQRREAAENHYAFVRSMVQLNDPPHHIRASLEEVWAIEQGYDPDDLAKKCPPIVAFSSATRALIGDPFEWLEIPAGKVTLEDASDGNPPGTKGGTYDVPSFWIAKYPVTVSQYEAFMRAGGYQKKEFWTEAGWQWREKEKIKQPRYWGDEDVKEFFKPDHPIIGVSWYESLAFCTWLNNSLLVNGKGRGGVKDSPPHVWGGAGGGVITLPTEQQWQRAAQGDDGRTYAWGNQLDSQYCNYDGNIGHTTPVTQYPKGASPYGVMDMTGNVWEWCLTLWGEDNSNINRTEVPRVVRGGSWYLDVVIVRVAFRLWYFPGIRNYDLGFRVVRSY